MTYYLAINPNYHQTAFGLFKDQSLIDESIYENKKISKYFVIIIKEFLENSSLRFADLSFIVTSKGPAPLTSLRVILSSINGLSFASSIPLIDVNGLELFLNEYKNDKIILALINAFANNLYFGLYNPHNQKIILGYESAQNIFKNIQKNYKLPIIFIGNGTTLYKTEIQSLFKNQAIIPEPLPENVSLRTIALCGLHRWGKKEEIKSKILPFYLKEPEIIIQP